MADLYSFGHRHLCFGNPATVAPEGALGLKLCVLRFPVVYLYRHKYSIPYILAFVKPNKRCKLRGLHYMQPPELYAGYYSVEEEVSLRYVRYSLSVVSIIVESLSMVF